MGASLISQNVLQWQVLCPLHLLINGHLYCKRCFKSTLLLIIMNIISLLYKYYIGFVLKQIFSYNKCSSLGIPSCRSSIVSVCPFENGASLFVVKAQHGGFYPE